MPRRRRGERGPADRAAVTAAKIAIGAIAGEPRRRKDEGKDPAAVALGRKGGMARARSMSAKRRKEIARKAARTRWKTAD